MRMKILLSFLITIASSTLLNAQIEKNSFLISGSTGFDAYSFRNFNWNFNTGVGYAVGKNSVISTNFGVSFYREQWNHNNSFTDKSTSYSAGLGWRKYMPIKGKFGWFTEINGTVEWSDFVSRYDSTTLPRSGSGSSYLLTFKPGLYYNVSKRVMLTADVGGFYLGWSKMKFADGDPTQTFHYDVNFLSSFKLGVNIRLGK